MSVTHVTVPDFCFAPLDVVRHLLVVKADRLGLLLLLIIFKKVERLALVVDVDKLGKELFADDVLMIFGPVIG